MLGCVVYEKGWFFDDVSGDCLCVWLGVLCEIFYDLVCFVILFMGLCFFGKGVLGDLLFRVECVLCWC